MASAGTSSGNCVAATLAKPALAGPKAVFATIAAVETFVDEHYREQIQGLEATASRGSGADSKRLEIWTRLVGLGSNAAVSLARYL